MWTQEEGVEAELATPWTEGGAMVAVVLGEVVKTEVTVIMADQGEMVIIDKLLGRKELTLAITKAWEMSNTHGNKLEVEFMKDKQYTFSTSHVANSIFVFIVLQNISILWEASKFRFVEGSIPNSYNFFGRNSKCWFSVHE